MKFRFWISILMLLLLVSLLLWHRSKNEKTALVPAENPTAIQQTNRPVLANVTQPEVVTSANIVAISNKAVQSGDIQWQQEIASKNAPVNFFGQCVDQNNEPVSGAKITMNVRHQEYSPTIGPHAHYPTIELTSDEEGRFDWADSTTTGDVIWIESMAKEGYLLSPKLHRAFAASSGSYENPVTFKMWKEQPKERLISGSHVFGIDSGKIYTLDLVSGKKSEGGADGDLRVAITRPSDANPQSKFPWSYTIEAIDGGLVEAEPNDEFMYTAPASGYEPQIEMQFDTNSPDWKRIVKKRFFLRSRNGQIYGRAEVEIDAIYNVHSAIQIDYALNPNGSPNLQP
jgi:hypothetical protein